MPPKTPKQLKRELNKRNKDRPADGHSMTAEGMKVENPQQVDLLGDGGVRFRLASSWRRLHGGSRANRSDLRQDG